MYDIFIIKQEQNMKKEFIVMSLIILALGALVIVAYKQSTNKENVQIQRKCCPCGKRQCGQQCDKKC